MTSMIRIIDVLTEKLKMIININDSEQRILGARVVKSLAVMRPGERGKVKGIFELADKVEDSQGAPDEFTLRLMEMGVTPGSRLEVRFLGPLGGDPIAFDCRGTLIALRLKEAQRVQVEVVP
jgi:Fe2+ transport system protein FeoA